MRRALLALALGLAACDAATGPTDPSNVEVRWNGEPQFRAQSNAPTNLPAFFDCLRDRGATIISAHRGGYGEGLAENAIGTFESTLAQTPAFLEVDVARTRDGSLVLMHDDTVDRTTNGSGDVRAMSEAEFTSLRLRDRDGNVLDAGPPTLAEALAWADGRTVLELDVKRGVSYEDVLEQVMASGAINRVIFITYSVDGASRIARLAPRAMIYTTIRNTRDLDTLEQRGVDLSRVVAWLGDDEFSEDLVEALEARGVESRFGMFDRGDDFSGAAYAGIASLSVNHTLTAFRAVDAADGQDGYAASQCVGAN